MVKAVTTLAFLIPTACLAQNVASSYATLDGRANTVVIACPSQDGAYSAGACPTATSGGSGTGAPSPVTYAAPAASTIVTANTAVTVFPAHSIVTGCDIVNSGSGALYVDFTTTAIIGAPTALPLQPGQSYHCPYPPAGAVSAIAAQPQPFVAIRY